MYNYEPEAVIDKGTIHIFMFTNTSPIATSLVNVITKLQNNSLSIGHLNVDKNRYVLKFAIVTYDLAYMTTSESSVEEISRDHEFELSLQTLFCKKTFLIQYFQYS